MNVMEAVDEELGYPPAEQMIKKKAGRKFVKVKDGGTVEEDGVTSGSTVYLSFQVGKARVTDAD